MDTDADNSVDDVPAMPARQPYTKSRTVAAKSVASVDCWRKFTEPKLYSAFIQVVHARPDATRFDVELKAPNAIRQISLHRRPRLAPMLSRSGVSMVSSLAGSRVRAAPQPRQSFP